MLDLTKQKNNEEFVNKLYKHPSVLGLIKKHTKKFRWLTYAYIGPVMEAKDTINLIYNSLSQKESIDQQIIDIKKYYRTLKKEKKEIINNLKLPKELQYLFKMSAFFMYLKDSRKGIYQKSYVAMDPIIEEIGKRTNLTVEEVKYLNKKEINEALIENKNFKTISSKRTKYCVAVTKNGKTKVYENEEAKNIIEKQTSKEIIRENLKEFKGSTAYPGKVRGIAKIICITKDIPKINDGEILVSSATNPNLITAMKKAAAFITDTGGITCHASIVARELRKPCIIGTKIATQVLKDGDMVEVDADEGVVRIIKKAG